MKDLMQEARLPEPEYNTEGMFTVSLKRPSKTSEKVVEETVETPSSKGIELASNPVEETVEEIIINLILNNPRVTANEMIKATGLSRRGVEYQLVKLKDLGRISRFGSTKAGYWKIRKPKGK